MTICGRKGVNELLNDKQLMGACVLCVMILLDLAFTLYSVCLSLMEVKMYSQCRIVGLDLFQLAVTVNCCFRVFKYRSGAAKCSI